MKKFVFSLETLLRHRTNLEEKERTALSQINFRLRNELRTREEIARKQAEAFSGIATAGQEDLGLFVCYLKRLRHESERTERNIREIGKELEAQKTVVLESAKKKKVIDALKAKQKRAYDAEVEKGEQKTIDELTVMRFGRDSGVPDGTQPGRSLETGEAIESRSAGSAFAGKQ